MLSIDKLSDSHSWYDLKFFLGGDIEFLHTIMGLQNCSSSYPCVYCLTKLRTLQDDCDPSSGELRTKAKQQVFLKNVKKHSSVTKQKQEAKENGSTLNEPLIPIKFSCILLAILHIILGVTKKLWDVLVIDVQNVDYRNDPACLQLIRARDIIAQHVNNLDTQYQAEDKELKDTQERKKETYELYLEARKNRDETNNPGILGRLKRDWKEVVQLAKGAQAKRDGHDNRELPAYAALLDATNEYLQNNRGLGEHALENVIGLSPIFAKHNPFYGGSFNGNDCFRLLHNFSLLFTALCKAYDVNCNDTTLKQYLHSIADKHEKVWSAWAGIAPVLRSTRLLKKSERANLLEDIEEFVKLYLQETDGSIILKLHHLAPHAKSLLDELGTLGFFAEDSMESIHAIINTLAR